MRKFFLTLCACLGLVAAAETPWQYVNARDLRMVNKAFNDTERYYTRLPSELKDSVRENLWHVGECSAGLALRFATDSRRVGVKYQLLRNFHMVHMADTGTKGTDLYVFEGDSAWRHVNTNRPYVDNDTTKICEATYLENFDGQMHEYMVYLPLYDGIEELWIKIDSGATITNGNPELIRSTPRIVAYGTSILQGGCASRTGMAATNIIGRELNCDVANLGFSGEAKMDFCMARKIAEIEDADVYLLDPVPNCTLNMCDSLTYDFVNILRQARPQAKIVMVEGPIYPYARYNSFFGNYLPQKNEAFRKNYERLKAENPQNLYYVDSIELDGPEDDGTVDGIHLTDLGFRHYADKLLPLLRELISE